MSSPCERLRFELHRGRFKFRVIDNLWNLRLWNLRKKFDLEETFNIGKARWVRLPVCPFVGLFRIHFDDPNVHDLELFDDIKHVKNQGAVHFNGPGRSWFQHEWTFVFLFFSFLRFVGLTLFRFLGARGCQWLCPNKWVYKSHFEFLVLESVTTWQ